MFKYNMVSLTHSSSLLEDTRTLSFPTALAAIGIWEKNHVGQFLQALAHSATTFSKLGNSPFLQGSLRRRLWQSAPSPKL